MSDKFVRTVDADMSLCCDGCYGVIELFSKQLLYSKAVDAATECTANLLDQLRNGATVATVDDFTGVIVDE